MLNQFGIGMEIAGFVLMVFAVGSMRSPRGVDPINYPASVQGLIRPWFWRIGIGLVILGLILQFTALYYPNV